MSGAVEIERKFLVKELPDLGSLHFLKLMQGYIATSDTEVRLRSDGSKHMLTCKRGSGLTRLESEVEISVEQFDALWPLTEGCRIEKTRYHMDRGEHLVELDVYQGSLEPLVVAEVEFASEGASREFAVPDFFAEEVTSDARYKNKNLAKEGMPS
ncbi:CYTH domain-containing protein [Haloferula sp.]|uniref:CYTH domain-containing protein n=1 Tax=Haloferula sp. TaxID=2497595 RepID=UPI00329DBBC5